MVKRPMRTGKPQKRPEQYEEFAKNVHAGKSLRESMLLAGWSENVANQGAAAISQPMMKALLAKGVNFAKLGEKLEPKMIEDAITGKLYMSMLTGESKGLEAAHLLGKSRRVNMFTPDVQQGVVVVNFPAEALKNPPKTIELPEETE